MNRLLSFLCLLSVTVGLPSGAVSADRPNVLLICVDDLRPELACFGASYVQSPHIDRLAAEGRAFHRHYVQAPTCGASRCALLTGRYAPSTGNKALFERAKKIQKDADSVSASLPAWFRRHGYQTVSVGKVSHHPGGLGGKDWDDPNELEMPDSWDRHLLPAGAWKHPRGWMHGLAHGEIRVVAGEMDVFQAVEGSNAIYPDGPSVDEALRQMKALIEGSSQPFFLAVGILRPHLPFGAPAKYRRLYDNVELPPIDHPQRPTGRTTWHRSGEFRKYNCWHRDPNTDPDFADEVRRHYAACVSYADASVGRLMSQLRASQAADSTIVVLWGDHGWHLGEHGVWGKHTLFEESLRSPLIIAAPGMSQPGQSTPSMVESIDLFPTLCELTGVDVPAFVHGVSLKPLLDDPDESGHPAVSWQRSNRTIRTGRYRLVTHGDGHMELYDHSSPAAERNNIAADNIDVAERLRQQLESRLSLE